MTSTANPYRLGRDIVPSAYRIFLTPDLEAATFAGRVEIDVDVLVPTPVLVLHALDLEVGEETVATYRKRAYQRLGIGSRHELFQLYLALL